MRVLHCIADLDKEEQPLAEREVVLLTPSR